MRQDLYDLLQAAKADPPPMRHSVDDFVAGGRRLQGRRRVVWAGCASAGAVMAVAAAIVVPQVVMRSDGESGPVVPPAAAPVQKPAAGALAYPDAPYVSAFNGYRVGEFIVSDPVLNTPGYQQAIISRGKEVETLYGTEQGKVTYPSSSAALTVYRPGAYDPARFSAGAPVTVNGRPGLFAEDMPLLEEPGGDNEEPGGDVVLPPNASDQMKADTKKDDTKKAEAMKRSLGHGVDRPSLAWQYADNSWAVISTRRTVDPRTAAASVQYDRQDLIDIGAGLSGAAPKAARLAFTVSQLPAGYRLTSVGTVDEYLFGGPSRSYARFVKGAQSYTGLTEPVMGDQGPARSISISLVPRWWGKYSSPKGAPAHAPFCVQSTFCYRATDDGKYQIELMGSGGESQAELIEILKGLTIADLDKPSSWYDLGVAVPAT